MRISDWSSDVCSSDLLQADFRPGRGGQMRGQREKIDRRVEDAAQHIDEGDGRQGRQCRALQRQRIAGPQRGGGQEQQMPAPVAGAEQRSEEHTSELQSLLRISYAVFCLKKKTITNAQLVHHLPLEPQTRSPYT